ncbi:hypothetical protein [Snodgrassella alvi]|nr:hypothetical protein [Snodgrassella alvi]ORF26864.1 hypothetical protein BGI08_10220 [Snodgrassella alvi]ORF31867.1 hypothetical protein BGI10_04135 [Snodgrassella alvi]ORF35791.1 hypothetical protein BGI11_00725 [Snodgrassella alvi]ORF39077.1 hypothetical protein BGI13_04170 [Snodgrassella alvi]ORF41287.1 hypothetical protein BGI14_03245 [Snodgrassella alvi]
MLNLDMFSLDVVESNSNLKFISEERLVQQELSNIDSRLTSDLFKDISSAALFQANQTKGEYFLKSAFSTFLPHCMVNHMRSKLIPLGWSKRDYRGEMAYTISPDKKSAFYICTGTKDVGYEYGIPSNSGQRGSEFDKQFELCLDDKTKVYVFLFYCDEAKNELRMELSIPSVFKKGRIKSWDKRIFLPSISLNSINDNFINRLPKPIKAENIEIKRKI